MEPPANIATDARHSSLATLQPVTKAAASTVGGLVGRSVFLQSPSPFPDVKGQPQQERDWLITVPQRDGALIFMIFVAPEADFAHLQPAYESMLRSMRCGNDYLSLVRWNDLASRGS